jgi:hypothetical protein
LDVLSNQSDSRLNLERKSGNLLTDTSRAFIAEHRVFNAVTLGERFMSAPLSTQDVVRRLAVLSLWKWSYERAFPWT